MLTLRCHSKESGLSHSESSDDAVLATAFPLFGTAAYLSALDQMGIISVTDVKGRITYVNSQFLKISGYTRDELIGKTHRIVKSDQHDTQFFRNMHRTIARGQIWRAPIKNRAKDGTFYWVDALVAPLKDPTGRVVGYFSLRHDITEAVGLHLEIASQHSMLEGVVESLPAGVCVYDKNWRMIVCNKNLKNLLNYPASLFANGPPTFEQVLRCNAERGEYGPGDIEGLVTSRMERARLAEPHITERRRPDGTELEIRGMPLKDGGFVTTYIDITQRKKDQQTIERLAHEDPLTGLANRTVFLDNLRQGLTRVRRGSKLAVLCLDLDGFKPVNDTFGHPVGDQVLAAVARRLKGCVRETDTVARLGGDEFAVLLESPKGATDIELVAKRIIATLSEPIVLATNRISIGVSIGITLAPEDAQDVDQLMKNADLALYRVKAMGKGQYGFFEAALQQQILTRNRLVSDMRDALRTNSFQLHYQPILSAKSRKIVGLEALVRWQHPERGLIPASEFIPAAEESGLIATIDDWVLETAGRQLPRWPKNIWVGVNISSAQLRGHDFVQKVEKALGDTAPERLLLEVTESMLISDKRLAADLMARLRNIGVRFALDDFGTGFSSLSYLQSFPFDKIKVDRSFVSPVADHSRSATLRRAIVQLARSLKMTCVAEGVETEEQLEALRREGCHEVQGFLFSPAMHPEAVDKLLTRGRL